MVDFKTHTQLVNEALDELASRTSNKIINPNTGTVIRSLMEAIFTIVFFVVTLIKKVSRYIYIEYAKGLFLDMLGRNYLLERRLPTYATTYVTITRSRDDIEEILQSGTICTTDPEVTGDRKEYILEENVKFPIGTVSAYGLVRALSLGTIGNTEADTITLIKNVNIAVDLVTNEEDVNNGVDIETDEELRDRLKNHIVGLLGGNERSIRDAAQSVEGVTYSFLLEDKNIPGICYLLVNNQDGDLSSSIISEVRSVIQAAKPFGITINITRSPVRNVSIYVKVKLKSTFIDSNAANLIKTSIRKYVNSLKPARYLRISDLVGHIEQISVVDYVYNDDGLQITIDDDTADIEDITSYTMIRTSEDLIEVDIA